MKNRKIKIITYIPICAAINIAGAFIASTLKLPVYLDTIGTFLSSFLFGPVYGAVCGAITSLVNGITSLYFMPVQIVIGLSAGILYNKNMFKGRKIILSTIIVTLIGSVISSAIAAYVFSGVTSSGSSYIVAVMKNMGIGVFKSVFSTQIITDMIDKFIAVFVVLTIMSKDIIKVSSVQRSNNGQV